MTLKSKLLGGAATMVMTASVAFAANVGVLISVGEPGFYGRLDIGDFPQPQLVLPKPVIIHQPVGVVHGPIYLRVPATHAEDWRQYCRQYGACSHPVYFVQDRWYNEVYVPRYRERHHPGKGYAKGHDKGHGKGRDRE